MLCGRHESLPSKARVLLLPIQMLLEGFPRISFSRHPGDCRGPENRIT